MHKHKREIAIQIALIVLAVIGTFALIRSIVKRGTAGTGKTVAQEDADLQELYIEEWPELDVQLLDINAYSRPGIAIDEVNGIVVHYTANPGTTAQQNRDYFEGLAQSHATHASSHFIIGLDGEIIQCIPCDEMAYASNSRNSDTISIECCIKEESGKFEEATYNSLVELVGWLIGRYSLTTQDLLRHYDITGKSCPKYFVDYPTKWVDFKEDVRAYIRENGVKR